MSVTEHLQRHMKKYAFAWTSAADGTTTVTTTTEVTGKVIEIVTVPGSGGTQPTNLYDLTLTDEDSVDILHGNGANRSNAANEYIVEASAGAVVNSKLTLNVTNAGASKTGTLYLYVK